MTTLSKEEIIEAAEKCAGNWKKFGSFAWHNRYNLEDEGKNPDDYFIWYTSTRDSRLLEESNAAVIKRLFNELTLDDAPYEFPWGDKPYLFPKSCKPYLFSLPYQTFYLFGHGEELFWEESHNHWACGYIDGWVIKVRDERGRATKPFLLYLDIKQQLDDYPVLDEMDYSNREWEATWENVTQEVNHQAWKHGIDLPEDGIDKVFKWIDANDPNELENVDDQGGWPSEESILQAFEELGYLQKEAV